MSFFESQVVLAGQIKIR